MAIIETLAVSVVARVNKFEKGMRRVRRNLDRTVRSFTGFSLRGLGALTGLAGAGGLGLLVKAQARAVDQTAKMSARLGVAFNDMRALQFAADRAGIGITQLQTGIQRMTRRVSEAAQGLGEAQGALRELGLDAGVLSRLAPDRQFERIARALASVGAQGDRVRLAFKVFDSEGVGLINLSAKALETARNRLQEFGLALPGNRVKSIEQFNDSLQDLKDLTRGLGVQITAGIAPVFSRVIGQVRNLINEMGGLGNIGSSIADTISAAFHNVRLTVARVELGFLRMKRTLQSFDRTFGSRAVARVAAFRLGPIEQRISELNRLVGRLEGRISGATTPRGPLDIQRALEARQKNRKGLFGSGGISDKLQRFQTGGEINPRLIDPNALRGAAQQNPQITRTNELLQQLVQLQQFLARS